MKENPLVGGYQASWLADGSTVAFLTEVVKPRELVEIHRVNVTTGESKKLFDPHQFISVVWDAAHNQAIAIEHGQRHKQPANSFRSICWCTTAREIADLESAQGELTISPSGKRVAFFYDGDVLEVRDLAAPSKFIHVRVGLGKYEWAPDERHILLKRGPESRSGNLMWVRNPRWQLHHSNERPGLSRFPLFARWPLHRPAASDAQPGHLPVVFLPVAPAASRRFCATHPKSFHSLKLLARSTS